MATFLRIACARRKSSRFEQESEDWMISNWRPLLSLAVCCLLFAVSVSIYNLSLISSDYIIIIIFLHQQLAQSQTADFDRSLAYWNICSVHCALLLDMFRKWTENWVEIWYPYIQWIHSDFRKEKKICLTCFCNTMIPIWVNWLYSLPILPIYLWNMKSHKLGKKKTKSIALQRFFSRMHLGCIAVNLSRKSRCFKWIASTEHFMLNNNNNWLRTTNNDRYDMVSRHLPEICGSMLQTVSNSWCTFSNKFHWFFSFIKYNVFPVLSLKPLFIHIQIWFYMRPIRPHQSAK